MPIGIIAALLAPRFLNESSVTAGQLDIPGAVPAPAGLLALVYGLTRAGNAAYGWSDALTIASLVAGVVLLVLFFLVESGSSTRCCRSGCSPTGRGPRASWP